MEAQHAATFQPIIDHMATTVWHTIRQCVTPITVIQGQRTIQWGTGTLFRIADESFLVTACHVWDQAVSHGFDHDLFVFDFDANSQGDATMQPVGLEGTIHRAHDPADVAVVQLKPEVATALARRRFLRLSEVTLRPHRPGRCWVFGFPMDALEEVPAASQVRFNQFFMLSPFCERSVALENYDPAYHFLLDTTDVGRFDGKVAEIPRRLNGISGSSIWQPEWPTTKSLEDWNANQTRIVGVQTAYYPNTSVIKATHWAAVANVLYQCQPRLRAAIELNLGPAE